MYLAWHFVGAKNSKPILRNGRPLPKIGETLEKLDNNDIEHNDSGFNCPRCKLIKDLRITIGHKNNIHWHVVESQILAMMNVDQFLEF